jgi:hypothetical protein
MSTVYSFGFGFPETSFVVPQLDSEHFRSLHRSQGLIYGVENTPCLDHFGHGKPWLFHMSVHPRGKFEPKT